jgi:hypothetical protein
MEATRRLRVLLPVLVAAIAVSAPAALGRSAVSCDVAKKQYAAITSQVKKAAAKVDHDGSGAVPVATFIQDVKRLQTLKARQRVAAQALHGCKR